MEFRLALVFLLLLYGSKRFLRSESDVCCPFSAFEVCSDSICDLTMNPSSLANSMVESRPETMVNPEMQIIQQISLSCCLDSRLLKNRPVPILFCLQANAELKAANKSSVIFISGVQNLCRKKSFVLEILLYWCSETCSPKHMKSSRFGKRCFKL